MDQTDETESLNECPMFDEHAIIADAYSTAQRAHFLKRGETQNILNHKWKLEFELLEAESYPIDESIHGRFRDNNRYSQLFFLPQYARK